MITTTLLFVLMHNDKSENISCNAMKHMCHIKSIHQNRIIFDGISFCILCKSFLLYFVFVYDVAFFVRLIQMNMLLVEFVSHDLLSLSRRFNSHNLAHRATVAFASTINQSQLLCTIQMNRS